MKKIKLLLEFEYDQTQTNIDALEQSVKDCVEQDFKDCGLGSTVILVKTEIRSMCCDLPIEGDIGEYTCINCGASV